MPPHVVNVKSANTHTDCITAVCKTLKLPTISLSNNPSSTKTSIFFHGTSDTDQFKKDATALSRNQHISKIAGGHEAAKKHVLAEVFRRAESITTSDPSNNDPSPLSRFWPKTFILPKDVEAATIALTKNSKKKKSKKKTFILKPSSGSQGEGILILQDATALNSSLLMWSARRNYILQQYIPNPHIMPSHRYKWDMRIYVTLLSLQPLKLVLHKEGLVRFCTSEYVPPDSSNLYNTMAHLTNYSLNKRSENYVQAAADEDDTNASKRALTDMLATDSFIPAGLTTDALYSRLSEVSYYAITSMLPMLRTHKYATKANPHLLTNAFQTFGLDVLVDDEATCWLLEVNSNPSMSLDHEGEVSTVDEKVKVSVMSETLALITRPDEDPPDSVLDISDGFGDARWDAYLLLFDDLSLVYRHLFSTSSTSEIKSISLTLILFRKLMKLLDNDSQSHIFDLVHQKFMRKYKEERDYEGVSEYQSDFSIMDLYDLFLLLEKDGRLRLNLTGALSLCTRNIRG